jgi:hypothetical protein
MNDRRYGEDEVREIFKRATTERGAKAPASPAPDGLTLAEVQSIGAEVGVSADSIARAAAALDASGSQHRRAVLGIPVEVGRMVPLERALTDNEWEQLVALLRSTFSAGGKISVHGNLREWRNGNLFVAHEPAGNGFRLRLGTRKSDAAAWTALGASGLVASAISWVGHIIGVDPGLPAGPILLAGLGIGALVANWVRMPAWAKTREAQMQQIAETVRAFTSKAP